jgi:esterase/lipase superfamily enzyme
MVIQVKKISAVVFAAMLVAACSGVGVQPLMPTPVLFSELGFSPLDHIPEDERWTPRRVYYATTRVRENNQQRIDYTNGESDEISLGMSLIGFGGSQLTWSDLRDYSRREDRPDVVDLSIAGLVEVGSFKPATDASPARDDTGALAWLMANMNASIEAARDDDLLIYVHGAKVNFYNANAFAAQLDHFMGRDMTSLAFSWPTRQNIVAYGSGADVQRAYRAAPSLASLLEELGRHTVARRIHIVCWSAGGRVVTAALRQLYERNADAGQDLSERFRLGTVYYAAADVPTQEFLDALPAINALASRIVVTVSSKDGALEMASATMGGGTRIGVRNTDLSEEQLQVVTAADHLEVVDVSRDWEGRGFDITGHRYWFDHPWASTDVVLAVRSDFRPQERGLASAGNSLLWAIPADYPNRLRASLTREGIELRNRGL